MNTKPERGDVAWPSLLGRPNDIIQLQARSTLMMYERSAGGARHPVHPRE
jgi:hypothetical protein